MACALPIANETRKMCGDDAHSQAQTWTIRKYVLSHRFNAKYFRLSNITNEVAVKLTYKFKQLLYTEFNKVSKWWLSSASSILICHVSCINDIYLNMFCTHDFVWQGSRARALYVSRSLRERRDEMWCQQLLRRRSSNSHQPFATRMATSSSLKHFGLFLYFENRTMTFMHVACAILVALLLVN